MTNANNEIRELKIQISILERKLNDNNGIIETLKQANDRLNAENSKLYSDSYLFEQENTKSKLLNEAYEKERTDVNVISYEQRIFDLNRKVEILTRQNKAAKDELVSYNELVTTLISDKESLINDAEPNLKENYLKLQKAHKMRLHELEGCKKENRNLLKKIAEYEEVTKDLTNDIPNEYNKHDNELLKAQINSLNDEIAALNKQLSRRNNTIREYQSRADKHTNEIRKLKQYLDDATKKYNYEFDQMKKKYIAEIFNLNSIIEQSRVACKDHLNVLETKHTNLGKLMTENRTLKHEKQELIDKNAILINNNKDLSLAILNAKQFNSKSSKSSKTDDEKTYEALFNLPTENEISSLYDAQINSDEQITDDASDGFMDFLEQHATAWS